MANLHTTACYSKVGQFFHLIPGPMSIHLDNAITQIVVYGIPSNTTLELLPKELTTFHLRLMMDSIPRWLNSATPHQGMNASSVVMTFS